MITNKQAPMGTNQHATTEELLEAVFSVVCVAAIAIHHHGKHVSAAMNPDGTMEELLDALFSARSVRKGCKQDEV
jgi:alkylhydroperoxidase/carboxymuconolactone decarboxylase family protein YurZ